jgi:fructose-bisphosphate aldolase class 1
MGQRVFRYAAATFLWEEKSVVPFLKIDKVRGLSTRAESSLTHSSKPPGLNP